MKTLFRKAEVNEEIIHLLHGYVQYKWPLLIWQTHARQSAGPSLITDFNITEKKFTVVMIDKKHKLDLNQNIYCKGEEKKLVFKSFGIGQLGHGLTLKLPEDLRLEELRSDPRFDMFPNKKAYMTILASSHYDSKETSYVFKLNDISTSGASLIMNSSNLMNFKIGDDVKVSQIGSDPVNLPFGAEIAYIIPMKSQGKAEVQLFKVGLKFTKRIIFYNYFLTRNLDK